MNDIYDLKCSKCSHSFKTRFVTKPNELPKQLTINCPNCFAEINFTTNLQDDTNSNTTPSK